MASAPSARDSATWYSSMMNSLRSAGSAQASRASTRNSAAPWKNGLSVSTDRHAAPARSYDAAIAAGSNASRSTPLLGLARLISAITAGLPAAIFCRSAAAKPRGGGVIRASAVDGGERPRDLRRDHLLRLRGHDPREDVALGHTAPTLAADAAALPPEGEQFAPWGGPAVRMTAPTLAADAAALSPEGEQFAPWGGRRCG